MTTRLESLLTLIRKEPGLTGPELASRMGVQVNFLSSPLSIGLKRKILTRSRKLSPRYPNIGQWTYFAK